MMGLLKNQIFWNVTFLLMFVAMLAAQQPWIAAALPVLALLAFGYVIVRYFWARAERRREAVAYALPDRAPAKAPTIDGTIQGPKSSTTIDPDEMAEYLNARVIGQEVVAEQLSRGIYRRMAQERRGKPVFTAMLSGPTGTGKTEMAKVVADYLFGDSKRMFRVDCANVIGEAGLQTLIGSPKGFAGSSSWGAMTAHLRSMPQTVILFDELEKAVTSPTAPMAKLLLSLLDEGIVTEQSDGTKVSATGAVILMTSNAAQEKLGEIFLQYKDNPEELTRAAKDTLQDFFAPEFLARIDLVTTVAPLSDEARGKIIALHTGRIGKGYGIEVETIDASFINQALERAAALQSYGTREVIRWVEEAIADQMIEARENGIEKVRIAWRDDTAVVEAA